MKQFLKIAVGFFVIFIFFALIHKPANAALDDGLLVRAENSENVYFIEEQKKRWVETLDVFRAQGFRWEDVQVVNANELQNMSLGANVGIYSKIVLPQEEVYFPDMTPFAVDDFLITELEGRTILKFTSTFWNMGSRALEVRNGQPIDPDSPDTMNVYQRILKDNDQYRERLINDFIWHEAHNHYHYENFIKYTLEPVGGQAGGSPVVKDKESFCFWDSKAINLGLESSSAGKVYTSCDTTFRHGVSVGWADVYERTLPDQHIDINDLPAGDYSLTIELNIGNSLLEQNYNNNKSAAVVRINPSAKTVQHIASGAPFLSAGSFNFPNGTLIKGDSSEEFYITHNNKKRQLRGDDVLAAYGYSADDAIVFPQGVIDAMPFNNLVRADGTKVYALNDDGYKRHIRNPAIFESYGLSWQDVADIETEEFSKYADARFVRVGGSSQLYYQYEHAVWPLSSSATTESEFPWSQLHIINSVDFNSYTVGPQLNSIPQDPPPFPSTTAVNDTDIPLTLPDGYRISYFTHMPVGPVRFMATSPDGILFVSRPSSTGLYSGNNQGGAVLALPDNDGNGEADQAIEVISGMSDYPHGLAFYNNFLYVAQQSTVSRYPYLGNAQLGVREVVVNNLPSDGGHLSRTITFSPEGKMYVSIGSLCNSCEESDNRRATIMEFNADGSEGRIYAEGLRNAVGITFKPGTSQLWATENGRDHLGDNLPPDEINIIQDGAHYGWPYCYGNKIADPAFNDASFCNTTQGTAHNIQAHSAVLGLRFAQSAQFSNWQGDLFVAYHGSWNRTEPTGYKVARLDIEGDSVVGEEDFIYGWLQGESKLGRPVDVIFGVDGALYISDDRANTIYRVEKLN